MRQLTLALVMLVACLMIGAPAGEVAAQFKESPDPGGGGGGWSCYKCVLYYDAQTNFYWYQCDVGDVFAGEVVYRQCEAFANGCVLRRQCYHT